MPLRNGDRGRAPPQLRANYGKERNGDRFRDFLQLVPDFRKRVQHTKVRARARVSGHFLPSPKALLRYAPPRVARR